MRALFIAASHSDVDLQQHNVPHQHAALHHSRELGLEELAGILMGTAAAPRSLHAAGGVLHPAAFGKRPMMLLAVLAGVGFYAGLVTLSRSGALIALQLLNAIFVGIVAGIGMSYFQDLMPEPWPGWQPPCLPTASATGSHHMAGAIAGTVAEISGVFTGSSWWPPPWRWPRWPPAGGCPHVVRCPGGRVRPDRMSRGRPRWPAAGLFALSAWVFVAQAAQQQLGCRPQSIGRRGEPGRCRGSARCRQRDRGLTRAPLASSSCTQVAWYPEHSRDRGSPCLSTSR